MHSGWQGHLPLGAGQGTYVRPLFSESSFGVTSPCLWTRKEKIAGEVESLRLSSITIRIYLFKAGASGKSTFKTKPAAAFGFLSFPRGTPMASPVAGA